MKKILVVAMTLGLAASPAFAAGAASTTPTSVMADAKGKMLMSSDGSRLALVYRVDSAGPQIIFEGRMVTVPGDTLKVVNGKLTTSLTKDQVIDLP